MHSSGPELLAAREAKFRDGLFRGTKPTNLPFPLSHGGFTSLTPLFSFQKKALCCLRRRGPVWPRGTSKTCRAPDLQAGRPALPGTAGNRAGFFEEVWTGYKHKQARLSRTFASSLPTRSSCHDGGEVLKGSFRLLEDQRCSLAGWHWSLTRTTWRCLQLSCCLCSPPALCGAERSGDLCPLLRAFSGALWCYRKTCFTLRPTEDCRA